MDRDCFLYEEGSDFGLKWVLEHYRGRVYVVKKNGEKVLIRERKR